jgi:hypothetical protein
VRFLSFLFALSSCYQSHERPAGDASTPRDGGRDAGPPEIDAGPLVCNRLAIPPATSLRNGAQSAVTPRVVSLGRGETGVVYVMPSVGSPTRVVYERLSRSLDRLTGPVTVTDGSFTWAEPVVLGDEIAIAHGLAGDRHSLLHHVDFGGIATRGTDRVAAHYPTILRASSSGIFWAAFPMETENALDVVHVGATGALLHPVRTIALGRYGSGHGAARVGGSHVLGYPREGPRGVRNGYVRAVNEAGDLGDERLLGDDGDNVVLPVVVGDELVLVRRNDDALVLERTDPETLERLERAEFPTTTLAPIAAAIGGRLLVVHVEGGSLAVDHYREDLTEADRYTASLPAAFATGTSIAEVPGGAVVALGLSEGSTSFPWILRIECAP